MMKYMNYRNGICNYSDVSMDISKGEMTVKDGDNVEDHWCMIMEKSLQKYINFLFQICHFNKIQEII
jgi:hypothetical protein